MTNVVVTGTSRGIGLELCRRYHAHGATVVAACRTPSAALSALGVEIVDGVDVATAGAAARLKAALAGRKIDLLINNAGVFGDSRLGRIDFDDLARQIAVNAIGPLRIAEALLDHLAAGAKLAFITSRMGSMADNSSGGNYAYRMSKAALNAAGVSLARDLAPRGISVALLHPGFVRTQLVGFAGDIDPAEAAARLAERIDNLTPATSGTFWHANGDVLPW